MKANGLFVGQSAFLCAPLGPVDGLCQMHPGSVVEGAGQATVNSLLNGVFLEWASRLFVLKSAA
jgi:hypothetical protein